MLYAPILNPFSVLHTVDENKTTGIKGIGNQTNNQKKKKKR